MEYIVFNIVLGIAVGSLLLIGISLFISALNQQTFHTEAIWVLKCFREDYIAANTATMTDEQFDDWFDSGSMSEEDMSEYQQMSESISDEQLEELAEEIANESDKAYAVTEPCCNWESRYKELQSHKDHKINELQTQIVQLESKAKEDSLTIEADTETIAEIGKERDALKTALDTETVDQEITKESVTEQLVILFKCEERDLIMEALNLVEFELSHPEPNSEAEAKLIETMIDGDDLEPEEEEKVIELEKPKKIDLDQEKAKVVAKPVTKKPSAKTKKESTKISDAPDKRKFTDKDQKTIISRYLKWCNEDTATRCTKKALVEELNKDLGFDKSLRSYGRIFDKA